MEPIAPKNFFTFLPVSLFGAILGLAGLSFSWGWAENIWNITWRIKDIFSILAVVMFLLLSGAYIIKWVKYPNLVKAEFKNPISVNFFGIFIISLLLLPGLILPYSKNIAIDMWIFGTLLIFLFAAYMMRTWLGNPQDPGNAIPAWIIPIVGTLDVPVVGYKLPLEGIHEICLVFLSIGAIGAIILIPVIFSRLLFQPPLPEPLQPTLLIMIVPFALLLTDYESLAGTQDMLAGIFYYFNLFLLLVFGTKVLLLAKCCPFRVTWWAVSFPLVATTIASFRYAAHRQSYVFKIVPAMLLTVSTIVIVYLLIQSFYRIFTNQLFLAKAAAEKATEILQAQ